MLKSWPVTILHAGFVPFLHFEGIQQTTGITSTCNTSAYEIDEHGKFMNEFRICSIKEGSVNPAIPLCSGRFKAWTITKYNMQRTLEQHCDALQLLRRRKEKSNKKKQRTLFSGEKRNERKKKNTPVRINGERDGFDPDMWTDGFPKRFKMTRSGRLSTLSSIGIEFMCRSFDRDLFLVCPRKSWRSTNQNQRERSLRPRPQKFTHRSCTQTNRNKQKQTNTNGSTRTNKPYRNPICHSQ